MNSSAAGQKLAPIRPKSINFADTRTATLHLRDKEKWANETACPYVEGCRAVSRRSVSMSAPSHPYPQRSSLT